MISATSELRGQLPQKAHRAAIHIVRDNAPKRVGCLFDASGHHTHAGLEHSGHQLLRVLHALAQSLKEIQQCNAQQRHDQHGISQSARGALAADRRISAFRGDVRQGQKQRVNICTASVCTHRASNRAPLAEHSSTAIIAQRHERVKVCS